MEGPEPPFTCNSGYEVPSLELHVLRLVHDHGSPALLGQLRRTLERAAPVLGVRQVLGSGRAPGGFDDALREATHGVHLDARAGETRGEPLPEGLREAQ